jgi:hypothetical protein
MTLGVCKEKRSMEHKHLDQLRNVADVQSLKQTRSLSRQERIDRWVELLERDPTRRLNSLGEIEYKPPAERALVRADDSPLTVAYQDPVLRAEGLASDRLGDAMNFFELSDNEAHRALCSCLGGRTMESRAFAQRVRGATTGGIRTMFGAWVVFASAVAVPSLLYLFE